MTPRLLRWQEWPLALRLTLFITILVTGIVVSLTWITLRQEQADSRAELQLQAELLLGSLSGPAGEALANGEFDVINDLVAGLGERQVLLFGRAYDANEQIIADAFSPNQVGQPANDPLTTNILASDSLILSWQGDRLLAGQPIFADGQKVGALTIGLPTARLDEKLATIRNQGVGLALAAVILGIVVAFIFGRTVTRQLDEMIEVSRQMAAGDKSARINIQGQNELGMLAEAFNSLADELQQSIGDLEQRTLAVATSAEISRRLSTILDTKELVQEVVSQIQTAFGYYHAHIYLLDDGGENLVMVGGTGQAGQEMLARNHQIGLGQGLVGQAAASKASILVPDVSQDASWLSNPLLPETRAETAVPIIYGDVLFGVLDVQHNLVDGLKSRDVDLLEAIAAQVAIALQNAHYYHQAQFKTEREARFNELARTVQNTTDLESALQVAVRELGRVLEAKQIRVQLHTGLNGREHEG